MINEQQIRREIAACKKYDDHPILRNILEDVLLEWKYERQRADDASELDTARRNEISVLKARLNEHEYRSPQPWVGR